MKFFLLAFSLLLPHSARAASYCKNLDQLIKETPDCTENQRMSEAGVLCLQKFEKTLKTSQATLSLGLAGTAAQSKASQSSKEANAKVDYSLSIATLDALIAQAKGAQMETGYFLRDLALPEDADEPRITGPDVKAFLDSDPCFKDNRDVLADVMQDFDNDIAQLEEARDMAVALKGGSTGNESSLDSLGAPVAKGAAGKSHSAPPAKKKQGPSDITGIQEDKAKSQPLSK